MAIIYTSEKATKFLLICWFIVFFSLTTLQWFDMMAFVSVGILLPIFLLFFKESRNNVVNNFKQYPVLWITMLPFFIQIYSVFYSENLQYWGETLGLRLHFVVVMLSLSMFATFNKNLIYKFLYSIVALTAILALITDVNVFLYSCSNTIRDCKGVLLTPTDHIIFTIAIAISFFIGLYLYNSKEIIVSKYDKYILAILTAIIGISLHYIPVRSGLVGFYVGIIVLILQKIFTSKAYKTWLIVMVGVCILPFVVYFVVPKFQQKVNLTLKEVTAFKNSGIANGSSDGNRLLSWKIAIDLWGKEPILGIGAGDIRDEVFKVYEQKYPEVETKIVPHSMWFIMLLGGGIIGLVLFAIWVFVPLIKLKLYNSTLYLPIWAVTFMAMLPNVTLQVNSGSSLVSIMLGLCTFVAIKLEQHKIN